ncbi:MAG: hypothetical protein JW828_00915 [Sedimentisphaerales bacterium]|nr:hypothetical protein [Sedimentisphaerales bacterium]
MADQEPCGECLHRQSCLSVYERLGRRKGPGVAGAVIAAFIVPIVTFILVLAAGEKLLTGSIASEGARTATAAAAALAGTGLCIGIVWIVRRRGSQSSRG